MTHFHCTWCGHHHGHSSNEGTVWPSCGAYTYNEAGGTRRCGCIGQQRQEEDQ